MGSTPAAPGAGSRTIRAIVAATPADRDRWADALRAGSLLVVVLGHWLMVVLTPAGEITNALTIVPALQPLTWLLQVMPLFFLVGGVAHAHTLARGRGSGAPGRYAAFVRARAGRLLRPSLAFLLVYLALGVVAHVTGLTARPGADGRLVRDALVLVPQLLWFIGIYLGVCAAAPAMYRLHRRIGWYAAGLLVLAAGLIDVVRFTAPGLGLVGNLNFAFVWLAVHQLGFCWRDAVLTPRVGWLMLVGGYGAMGLLVALGPYPTSMVGLPGEAVSNMAPPTVALLAQGIGISGLAVLLRPVMSRLLARPRAWAAVVIAGPYAMTAFLWHLTGLMVVLLAMRALGVVQPAIASAAWWLTRPALFLVLGVVTAALVAVFARFDRGPSGQPRSAPERPAFERPALARPALARPALARPALARPAPNRSGREWPERGRRGRGRPQLDRPAPAGSESERRRWVDPMAAVAALVLFFGIVMVSIVGVDVLGNRPVFFLVGDVTPLTGILVLAAGLGLLAVTRPRTAAPP